MINKELYTSEKSITIFRCPNCYNIPYITPRYVQNQIIIGYKCSNNHFGDKDINEFYKESTNHSIFIKNCEDCNLSPDKSDKLFSYCTFKDCKKILCSKCKKNHQVQGHQICPLYKYDSTCLIHNDNYISYCKTCNKNFCIWCKKEHEMHDIFDLYKVIPSINSDEFTKIVNLSKEIENNFKNLKKIKNDIIESLKNTIQKLNDTFINYEKWFKLKINFIQSLVENCSIILQQKNFRFELLYNLKFINDLSFGMPSFNDYENDLIKAEKLVSYFLLNLQSKSINNIQKLNSPQTINSSITKILEIPIGLFIVCFSNGNLWLFTKDTFEIKQKINLGIQINDIILLKSGKIGVVGSNSFLTLDIHTSEYKKLQSFNINYTYSICELTNNDIIIGTYQYYYLYKKEDGINYYLIKQFYHNYYLYEIKQISNNEFAIASEPKTISFVNIENYQIIANLTNNNIAIQGNSNCMNLINPKILGVAGKNGIYFINILDHTFIQKFGNSNYICFFKSFYGTFLFGNSHGNIEEWKIEGDNRLIKNGEKKKSHNKQVNVIIQLYDGKIITGSSDGTLYIWI